MRKRLPFFEGLDPGAYGAIAIDPAWDFKSNSTARPGRNARRHYRCMSLDEILPLPVGDYAAETSWLFLWITAPFLAIGAHVPIVRAWGFKVSTVGFTWTKTTGAGGPLMRKGHSTRIDTEFVVIGRRGQPKRASSSVLASIIAPAREHSRKPDEFYRRVEELAGDVRRADIFARESRAGWETWGMERTKFDPPAAPVRRSAEREAG